MPPASSFATYFPIMSFSRFTGSPAFFVLRIVFPAVCGMIETVKHRSSTETTVRLMPSIAIEPFSTMPARISGEASTV